MRTGASDKILPRPSAGALEVVTTDRDVRFLVAIQFRVEGKSRLISESA